MKTLILNNWPAKIASLVLASVLWFLIKKNIEIADPDVNGGQTPAAVMASGDPGHHGQ